MTRNTLREKITTTNCNCNLTNQTEQLSFKWLRHIYDNHVLGTVTNNNEKEV